MLGRLIIITTLIHTGIGASNLPKTVDRIAHHEIQSGQRLDFWLVNPAPTYKFRNKKQLHKYIESTARAFTLPPNLLKRIIAVESSNCRYRHNKVSNDLGCAQLNHKTIKLYGWNVNSVVKNDMLNIVAAAIILKDFKKAFPDSYACRYNTGYRNLPVTCANYLAKLASINL